MRIAVFKMPNPTSAARVQYSQLFGGLGITDLYARQYSMLQRTVYQRPLRLSVCMTHAGTNDN